MRIVFMGTPDFAIPSLGILVKNGFDIVGVITSTDKLGGRGKNKLIESPVKKYAVEKGLTVLQPKNLKAPEFIDKLKSLKADLQVVVAFRMLPEVVWNMPPLGTINLHGSLLPRYRGAAPINWAIIKGEKITGVTSFFLKHQIDTGDVLFREPLVILPDETAGDMHDQMMILGAQVILKSVLSIEKGDYTLKPQDNTLVTKAPKIFHETCEIDFTKDTQTIHNFIRGLSPYPCAWTMLDDLELKIYRAEMELEPHQFTPGTYHTDGKTHLKIATSDGFINLLQLKLQGKRKMHVRDFVNGYRFKHLSN